MLQPTEPQQQTVHGWQRTSPTSARNPGGRPVRGESGSPGIVRILVGMQGSLLAICRLLAALVIAASSGAQVSAQDSEAPAPVAAVEDANAAAQSPSDEEDAGLPVANLERSEPVDYAEEVFPALKRNCLACHNATKAKAGLNLESAESMITGGDSGPALVPGTAADSLVFLSAAHREDPAMPPAKNKSNARNLTPRELALLERWIDEGAVGGERRAEAESIAWRPSVAAEAPVYRIALTDDGRLAAAARGRDVVIYNIASGLPEGELDDPEIGAADLDYVQSVAFGPDGVVATGGFRTVRIWRRESSVSSADPSKADEFAGESGGAPPILIHVAGASAPIAAARTEDGAISFSAPGPDGVSRDLRMNPGEGTGVGGIAVDRDLVRAAFVRESDPSRVTVLSLADTDPKVLFEADPAMPERMEVARIQREEATAQALAAVRDQQHAEAVKARDEETRKLEEATAALTQADETLMTRRDELESLTRQKTELEEVIRQLETAGGEGVDERKSELEAKNKEIEPKSAEVAEAEKARTAAERNRDLAQRLADNATRDAEEREGRKSAAAVTVAQLAEFRAAAESTVAAVAEDAFVSAAFDLRTGLLITRQAGGRCLVWNPADGRLVDIVHNLDPGRPEAYAVRWTLERTIGSMDDPSILPDRVSALDFSADGRILIAGSGVPSRSGVLAAWEIESGERLWVREDAHSDTINDVAISPAGLLVATASSDRMARVFSMEEGDPVLSFEGHGSYVTSVAWRADGLRIATGGTDNTVRLWESETSKPIDTRRNFKRGVAAVAYRGPADEVVAAAGDPSLRVENDAFFGEGVYLHDAAVSADGGLIAVGAQDGTLRVWSWPDKKLVSQFDR